MEKAKKSVNELQKTIDDYAESFYRMSGVRVDVKMDERIESLNLPAEAELQLIRIMQEALANIRKHSQSEEAWIDLTVDNGALIMTIGDQGVGFDTEKTPSGRGPHFGLASMRERAQSIGAHFNIDSEPGEGTRVEVIISLGANQ